MDNSRNGDKKLKTHPAETWVSLGKIMTNGRMLEKDGRVVNCALAPAALGSYFVFLSLLQPDFVISSSSTCQTVILPGKQHVF